MGKKKANFKKKSISPIREMNFTAHDCLFHKVGTLLGENSFHASKMSVAIFLSYSWSVHLFMGKLGYLVRYFKQFLSSRHSQDLRKEKKLLLKFPSISMKGSFYFCLVRTNLIRPSPSGSVMLIYKISFSMLLKVSLT